MELKIPSPEQAYWGLRAMKTVASKTPKSRLAGSHILIVEDEMLIAMALADMVTALGCTSVLAARVTKAVALVSAAPAAITAAPSVETHLGQILSCVRTPVKTNAPDVKRAKAFWRRKGALSTHITEKTLCSERFCPRSGYAHSAPRPRRLPRRPGSCMESGQQEQ